MLHRSRLQPLALWLAAFIFSAFVITDSWFRWATYQYRTFDLAFYTHTLWLALHGQWHSTLLDVSLMGNHAEPICFLLLPFFALCRHPMFFVVVQAVFIATMPFTGYRIARVIGFKSNGALWMALATLAVPASGFIALHEFHPEALSAPLLLLMLEARLRKRAKVYWLWFLLALSCKENVGIMLVGLCFVFALLDEKRGRHWQLTFNLLPGLCAAAWVAAYLFWLRPLINGGRVDYDELYAEIGGLSGVLHSPVKALAAAWRATLAGNLVYGLLVPLGLLPLLRPRWLLISAPILAQHLLSSRPSEWTIYYHYSAPLIPLLWYATAEASTKFRHRNALAGGVLVVAVGSQWWIGPIWPAIQTARDAHGNQERAVLRTEMLENIPEDASVVAGLPYLSHLANREQLYSLHHVTKGLRTLSRAEYVPPSQIGAVLMDAEDSATLDRMAGYDHPTMRTVDGRIISDSEVLLERFLARENWRRFSRNEMTLLLKVGEPQEKPAAGQGTEIDAGHQLVSAQFAPALQGDSALILLHLEFKPDPTFIPWVSLILQGREGNRWVINKGAIGLGEPPGKAVTETWAIRRPAHIPEGTYHAYLRFYDHHAGFRGAQKQAFQDRIADLGELQLR